MHLNIEPENYKGNLSSKIPLNNETDLDSVKLWSHNFF